jgi:hypothetical protein
LRDKRHWYRVERAADGCDGFIEEDRIFGDREGGLFGMAFVIQAEAADCLDIASCKRSKQKANIRYLVGHSWRAENISFYDTRSLGFGDVRDALGQNGVTIIGVAVTSEEAYKSLASHLLAWERALLVMGLTENAAMINLSK